MAAFQLRSRTSAFTATYWTSRLRMLSMMQQSGKSYYSNGTAKYPQNDYSNDCKSKEPNFMFGVLSGIAASFGMYALYKLVLKREGNKMVPLEPPNMVMVNSLSSRGLLEYGPSHPNTIKAEAGKTDGDSKIVHPSKQFNFLAEAVDKASPAVVHIQARSTRSLYGMAVSSGSGFIIDQNGYIITNAHVVRAASTVDVKLSSGEQCRGAVLDIDEEADLALVKVSTGNVLPFLQLGSSAHLRPGEWVIAMGSPLSLSNTITAGIVSCVHRLSKDLGLHGNTSYIQTDASITVGNSGGPLVNLDGEVVGVNTLTATHGISFAIPSDRVRTFFDTCSRQERPAKGRRYLIGVSMLTVTPSVLQSLKQRIPLTDELEGGVFLAMVDRRGSGYDGGLRRGDIVVAVNGKKVRSTQNMLDAIQKSKGKEMKVQVWRGTKKLEFRVTPELSPF